MDVSRETTDDLRAYEQLLLKWNARINLIGRGTQDNAWDRHILDSLQLLRHVQTTQTIVDLGSGGGLPAIPLAIALRSAGDARVVLVESDRRKSEFLRTCIRTFSLNAEVHTARAEDLVPQNADVCTARALAPCVKLFGYAERHLTSGGRGFFLKGENAQAEIEDARRVWRFSETIHPSTTRADAAILEIKELQRA